MQTVAPRAHGSTGAETKRGRPAFVSVLSGKGGVGKTLVAANLAVTVALEMKGVLLVDCDLSAGQSHLVLGVSPSAGLAQAVRGEKRLGQIAMEVFEGLHFVAGGPSGGSAIELRDEEIRRLALQARLAVPSLRAVVLDAGAGRAPAASAFAAISDIPLVLTTGEPTAVRATVALLEAMLTERPEAEPYLVVNMAEGEAEAKRTYLRIVEALMPVYSVEPQYLGYLPHDPEISRSLCKYKPVVTESPYSNAAKGFRSLWASLAPHLGLGRTQTDVAVEADEDDRLFGGGGGPGKSEPPSPRDSDEGDQADQDDQGEARAA